jgi:hypothetical protein
MFSAQTHALIEDLALIPEVIGIGIIIVGVLLAAVMFMWPRCDGHSWERSRYCRRR